MAQQLQQEDFSLAGSAAALCPQTSSREAVPRSPDTYGMLQKPGVCAHTAHAIDLGIPWIYAEAPLCPAASPGTAGLLCRQSRGP